MAIKLIAFDWGGVCAQYKLDLFESFVTLNDCPATRVAPYFDKHKPDFDRDRMTEEQFWNGLKDTLGFKGPWTVLASNNKKNLLVDWVLLDTIRQFSPQVKTIILSNMDKTSIDAIRSEVHLKDYFTRTFFSSELKSGKLDDSVIRMICDEFSVIPSEILFIDDFEGNTKNAKQKGMNVILHTDKKDTLTKIHQILRK
jgi:FMN phosphatase YigB (HAD superfamily)